MGVGVAAEGAPCELGSAERGLEVRAGRDGGMGCVWLCWVVGLGIIMEVVMGKKGGLID